MADARGRFRSGTVMLAGMGLLAAALTACSSDPDKRCVDRDSYHLGRGYKAVADKNCTSTKTSVRGVSYYAARIRATGSTAAPSPNPARHPVVPGTAHTAGYVAKPLLGREGAGVTIHEGRPHGGRGISGPRRAR